MVSQIKNEIKIMYALDNDHIVKLHNHFEEEDHIYLILFDFIKIGLVVAPTDQNPIIISDKYLKKLPAVEVVTDEARLLELKTQQHEDVEFPNLYYLVRVKILIFATKMI